MKVMIDGTSGVFDDHYDPRQVTFSLTNAIHANLYQQYNSHVAYNAKHVISVDTSKYTEIHWLIV